MLVREATGVGITSHFLNIPLCSLSFSESPKTDYILNTE